MLRLVLQSGWAAPLNHQHGPGKIHTRRIQTRMSCFVPYCSGSPKIHGLLVGPHKAVGSGHFSCMPGPRTCPWLQRSLVSWQSPITRAWVRLSPGSGSCCHPNTRYLTVPLKGTTLHCCCSPQPSWLTHPTMAYPKSRISPWHLSSCFRCGQSHNNFFFFHLALLNLSCFMQHISGNYALILPAIACFAALAMTCLHTLISSSHTVFLLLIERTSRPQPV